jgi:hypothetical protein
MAQIGLMTTLDLRTTAVETNNKWFIYAVAEYSHILIDFHRNGLDSDSVVNDRVEIQTGLTPVDIRPSQHILDNPLTKTLLVSFSKPTKKYWSLFSSRAARLIDRTDASDGVTHAGTTTLFATAIDSQSVNAVGRQAILWMTVPHQNNVSTALNLLKQKGSGPRSLLCLIFQQNLTPPTFTSAQLARGRSIASIAD